MQEFERPEVLYHGRPNYVEIIPLEKFTAQKISWIKYAVKATSEKFVAKLHAIPCKGGKVLLKECYLYTVNVDDFEQLDEKRWASFKLIEPVDIEIIYPLQTLHFILNGCMTCDRTIELHTRRVLLSMPITSSDVRNSMVDIDCKSLNLSSIRKVGRTTLHNKIIEILMKYENEVATVDDLYQMLKMLDYNWKEFFEEKEDFFVENKDGT